MGDKSEEVDGTKGSKGSKVLGSISNAGTKSGQTKMSSSFGKGNSGKSHGTKAGGYGYGKSGKGKALLENEDDEDSRRKLEKKIDFHKSYVEYYEKALREVALSE